MSVKCILSIGLFLTSKPSFRPLGLWGLSATCDYRGTPASDDGPLVLLGGARLKCETMAVCGGETEGRCGLAWHWRLK
jgi:hypothetical protein